MHEKPKKAPILLLILVGAVFLGSLVLVLLGLRKPEQRRVEIVQNGQILRTIDLTHAKNEDIRIEAPDGSYNIVRIRDGEIWVEEAGCPDQTCVKMGKLRTESLPIVCLPNKLVIRFAEEGAQ